MSKPKQARGAERWIKQVRFDIEFAKRMVLERGSCVTLLVVYRPDNGTRMVLTPPAELSKNTVALYLRAFCMAEAAEAFSFISEAWMRRVMQRIGETEAEHDERANAIAPSEAEDRIEIVIAELTYRDDDGARRTLAEAREIVRDAKGEPVSFRTAPLPVGGAGGRWVDVLTPEPPTTEDRARAAAAIKTLADIGFTLARYQ